jgi:hypothetical protein
MAVDAFSELSSAATMHWTVLCHAALCCAVLCIAIRLVLFHVQDMFDAGLVLGDTDYRQLSYRDRGQLPGNPGTQSVSAPRAEVWMVVRM